MLPFDPNAASGPAKESHSPPAVAAERAVGYPRYGYSDFTADALDDGLDLRKYLRVIIKRRRLILGVIGVCILLGLIATFLMTPIYQATATLQIDREAANVVQVEGLQTSENLGDPQFYQTQYELLQSRTLAEKTVASIGLADDQAFLIKGTQSPLAWIRSSLASLFKAPAAEADTADANSVADKLQRSAVGALQDGLVVSPVRNSRLVKVSFRHPNAAITERVANGVAEAFIAANLDRKYDATSYARKFLEERLQQLKVKLEESEAQLVAYAMQQGIINLDDRQSLKGSDLALINTKLVEARNERIRLEGMWRQAQATKGFGLMQIMDNPTIQKNRDLRAQLAAEYQQKLGLYKPAFPAMIRLKSQIAELDAQAQEAIKVIKLSIKAQYDAAKREEEMLGEQVDMTKADVLDQRSRSIKYNILQREVDTNRTLYDGLLQRYKEIGVAGGVGTNNISVIDRAEIPGAPSSPKLTLNLLVSLLAGTMLGVAGAFGLEYLDDTFKSPEDVESGLAMPVIGIIPRPHQGVALSNALADARSSVSEAYRSLRTALQFSTAEGVPRTLLITSSRPSEGKSTTAATLARAFTQIGMKVLIIDADLRNPSLHKEFQRPNELGLSNYLAGAKLPQEVVQETNVKDLTFISSGPLPPNPAELLAGARLVSLLSLASESFDVVVVDGPPIMGLADAPLLASNVAGTLLVVAANETRREAAKVAVKRLHFARAPIVGALLSKFDMKQVGYGYGYAYGGYDYHSREEKDTPRLAAQNAAE
jgi:polysaccharide biosynthesis transport protein